jgi:hypothetical protein
MCGGTSRAPDLELVAQEPSAYDRSVLELVARDPGAARSWGAVLLRPELQRDPGARAAPAKIPLRSYGGEELGGWGCEALGQQLPGASCCSSQISGEIVGRDARAEMVWSSVFPRAEMHE